MTIAKNFSIGKKSFTAKDYVRDGLLFLFDGIENAGFGKHHSDITKPIVNLATGEKFSYGNNGGGLFYCAIEEKCFRTTTDRCAIYLDGTAKIEDLISVCHGEFCYDGTGIADDSTQKILFKTFHNGNVFGTTSDSTKSIIALNGTTRFSLRSDVPLKRLGTVSVNYQQIFRDGDPVETFQGGFVSYSGTNGIFGVTSNNGFGPINARVFCVRLYNRELLPHEVMHNWIVDKERFSL